jgi:hypothetical protein
MSKVRNLPEWGDIIASAMEDNGAATPYHEMDLEFMRAFANAVRTAREPVWDLCKRWAEKSEGRPGEEIDRVRRHTTRYWETQGTVMFMTTFGALLSEFWSTEQPTER